MLFNTTTCRDQRIRFTRGTSRIVYRVKFIFLLSTFDLFGASIGFIIINRYDLIIFKGSFLGNRSSGLTFAQIRKNTICIIAFSQELLFIRIFGQCLFSLIVYVQVLEVIFFVNSQIDSVN